MTIPNCERSNRLSVTRRIEWCLNRMADNSYNAYISVLDETARSRAQWLDNHNPADFPLYGTPVAVKDNIAVQGCPLTCASRILKGYKSPYSATAVQRLENAGAVIVAKTNMDEFGMGSSSEYSAFGAVKNPLNMERSSGGSSGGSAAAVACGDVPVALGSDTGGSVRQPAAFCGIPAIRPTYGAVSRFGLIAFASSMDQIGPMAANIKDLERVYHTLSGHDPMDMTSCKSAEEIRNRDVEPGDVVVTCLKDIERFIEDSAVSAAMHQAGNTLQQACSFSAPADLGDPEELLSAYYVISSAEASSNLARFDGVRFGPPLKTKSSMLFQDGIRRYRTLGFGPEVKRRIMIGTACLSEGYHVDLYQRAVCTRNRYRDRLRSIFQTADIIMLPTTPTLPFRRGSMTDDPVSMYGADIFTVIASLAGCPALSLPVPDSTRANGDPGTTAIPASIQLIAAPFREDILFKVGRFLEASWNR